MSYTFNSNCRDCDKCVAECPVAAVSVVNIGGHSVCRVDGGLCINCGVCGRVCEKNAVSDSSGKPVEYLPREQWPVAQIDYARCNGCMLCIEACPEYILTMSKPLFEGDLQGVAFLLSEEKCTGCGLCADSCPVQVISMGKRNASA